MLSVKAPGLVTFYDDEVERINRAQVALLLHMKPADVDTMPPRDIADVLAIHSANEELKARKR